MLVEREECCPEDHKQRNHLSLLPLSFLLEKRDGLESNSITSGFIWDFGLVRVLSKYACIYSYTHIHRRRLAISSVS